MERPMLQTPPLVQEADRERKERLLGSLRAALAELDELGFSAPAANYLSWAIALIEAE